MTTPLVAKTKGIEKRPPKRCGAKTRKEGRPPCSNWAMKNGRCHIHGGLCTGPKPENMVGNKNAVTYGFYAEGLLDDDEREAYSRAKLGDVDDEILLLKIRLRRLHRAQKAWIEQHGAEDAKDRLELVEEERSTGAGKNEDGGNWKILKRIRRKKDFTADIVRITRLIGELESRRVEMKNKLHLEDDPDSPLMKLRDALRGIMSGA